MDNIQMKINDAELRIEKWMKESGLGTFAIAVDHLKAPIESFSEEATGKFNAWLDGVRELNRAFLDLTSVLKERITELETEVLRKESKS